MDLFGGLGPRVAMLEQLAGEAVQRLARGLVDQPIWQRHAPVAPPTPGVRDRNRVERSPTVSTEAMAPHSSIRSPFLNGRFDGGVAAQGTSAPVSRPARRSRPRRAGPAPPRRRQARPVPVLEPEPAGRQPSVHPGQRLPDPDIQAERVGRPQPLGIWQILRRGGSAGRALGVSAAKSQRLRRFPSDGGAMAMSPAARPFGRRRSRSGRESSARRGPARRSPRRWPPARSSARCACRQSGCPRSGRPRGV